MVDMPRSPYIKAMHPKTAIRPDAASIRKILKLGWGGQLKIHGHRAQFHIPASADEPMFVYTRHGTLHRKKIPMTVETELRRLFAPKKGWTVIDCEWIKDLDKVYVFDVLKFNDQSLRTYTYQERWDLLPKVYKSPVVETLEIYRSVEKCMDMLLSEDELIEGLVFKSLSSTGFGDSTIVRCRKSNLH
jgi:hypothetical protein